MIATTCAALLAAILPGLTPADIDRARIYEVPAAMVASVPLSKLIVARACARRYGIHWKVVDGR